MVNNTLTTGYETSQRLFPFSCPSQPTLDLNAGASVGELSTVDDTLATEYEMLQNLSTWSGPADPSQCTFDLGAGTFATESTTVDNTWVTGYEASQLLLALSGPAEPLFNLDAGTSAVDDDDELTAELKALLSPSASSGGTNQFTPPKNGPRRRHRRDKHSQTSCHHIHRFRESLLHFLLGQLANNRWLPSMHFCLEIGRSTFQMPLQWVLTHSRSSAMGNVNAPQPSTFVPGTIGGTSSSFNDVETSNLFGGATIGAEKQVEAVLSTQTSQPLFDFGMTGGQYGHYNPRRCA